MKNSNLDLALILIQNCVILSLCCTMVNHILGYWLLKDGFSYMETAIYSVLPGISFGILILLLFTFLNINYYKLTKEASYKSLKFAWQYIISVISIILISIIFDSIAFYFVDDSISIGFANGLGDMAEQNNEVKVSDEALEALKKFPNFIQNIGANILFIIIFTPLSLLITKKIAKTSKVDYLMN